MRAKLHPLGRTVCSRQYKDCRYNVCTSVTEKDAFSSIATGETFQINHKINCDDECLAYLLKCKVCKKQYVRETTDTFSLGRKITRTMRGNFREIKVACNIIFMSIFRAKFITDSWGVFL